VVEAGPTWENKAQGVTTQIQRDTTNALEFSSGSRLRIDFNVNANNAIGGQVSDYQESSSVLPARGRPKIRNHLLKFATPNPQTPYTTYTL